MAGRKGQAHRNRTCKVVDRRQQAWNSMRVHKTFTAAQIRATAEIGEDNLKKLIQALHRAGYLRLQRPRQSGKTMGGAVWCLIRPTGPKCPIVRGDGAGVYDPNEDRVYAFREEGEQESVDERRRLVNGPA